MLRTSECKRYTLKVTCRLNLRAHSSSSLPLQSAAHASASTRPLCAPQRAHNAVSFCQCALPCDRLAWKFGGHALPPQLQRVLALSPAKVASPVRFSAQLACSRSFPPSSPFGKPGEESLRPTLLPADSCRTAGIEEMGLHRNRQSVVACNRRPRVGNSGSVDCGRLPEGTSASPKPVAAR